jgi:hypothetical protein
MPYRKFICLLIGVLLPVVASGDCEWMGGTSVTIMALSGCTGATVPGDLTVNNVGIGAPTYSQTRLRLGNPPAASETAGSGAQLAFGTTTTQNWAFRLDAAFNLHLDRCCWGDAITFSYAGPVSINSATAITGTASIGAPLLSTTRLRLANPPGDTDALASGAQLAFGTADAQFYLYRLDANSDLHIDRQSNLGWREGLIHRRNGVVDINSDNTFGTTLRLFDTTDMAALVGGGVSFVGKTNGETYTTLGSIKGVKNNGTSGDMTGAVSVNVSNAAGTVAEIAHFSTGNLHVNGTISGTNIQANFQDVAEWVSASETMPPGTVVTISAQSDNGVQPSSHAYDTSVAGVVSAEPGVILGIAGPAKAKIATAGRVKVRVDATHAQIRRGDLLVTSDEKGMAMKSESIEVSGRRFHQPGTVIGKALEPLASGRGEILVLLSLQ